MRIAGFYDFFVSEILPRIRPKSEIGCLAKADSVGYSASSSGRRSAHELLLHIKRNLLMRCLILGIALLFGCMGQPAFAQVGDRVTAEQMEKQVKRNRTSIRLLSFGVLAVGALVVWGIAQKGRQEA
jgi:hypothetical protein